MIRCIPIGLVSEVRLFRESLAWRLSRETWIRLCGTAASAGELLAAGWAGRLDLVLVQATSSQEADVGSLHRIQRGLPGVRILMLGQPAGGAALIHVPEAGWFSCISEGAGSAELLAAIRDAAAGPATAGPATAGPATAGPAAGGRSRRGQSAGERPPCGIAPPMFLRRVDQLLRDFPLGSRGATPGRGTVGTDTRTTLWFGWPGGPADPRQDASHFTN